MITKMCKKELCVEEKCNLNPLISVPEYFSVKFLLVKLWLHMQLHPWAYREDIYSKKKYGEICGKEMLVCVSSLIIYVQAKIC